MKLKPGCYIVTNIFIIILGSFPTLVILLFNYGITQLTRVSLPDYFIETDAFFVSKTYTQNGLHKLNYEFEANNEKYIATTDYSTNYTPKINDSVKIKYNPKNPNEYTILSTEISEAMEEIKSSILFIQVICSIPTIFFLILLFISQKNTRTPMPENNFAEDNYEINNTDYKNKDNDDPIKSL